jgi:hypothetical protein
MWKGILMLFAIGAGPTDPPIKITSWGQVYSDFASCQAAVDVKAAELNQVYATAGEPARWVSACVPVR